MARWVLVAVFETEDEADYAQRQVSDTEARWSHLRETTDPEATVAILERPFRDLTGDARKDDADVVWEEAVERDDEQAEEEDPDGRRDADAEADHIEREDEDRAYGKKTR